MSINKDVYNIVQFLKKTLKDSGQNGFALGLSGGIDSAVCAALAKRAIDELHREAAPGDAKTYTLDLIILPIGNHSSDAEVAHEVAKSLGMDARSLPLATAFDEFSTVLTQGEPNPNANYDKCWGNVKARMRMTAIYFSANVHGLLVLGTDNASETYTGYFTKHGDGAADVFPISPFTKREVYDIGRFLKLPESVLSRAPTAGLWDGQTDEDEMGIPYDFIDNRIEDMEDFNKAYYGDHYLVFRDRLNALHLGTEHKRKPPHVFKRDPDFSDE